jgi:hypothetical protein
MAESPALGVVGAYGSGGLEAHYLGEEIDRNWARKKPPRLHRTLYPSRTFVNVDDFPYEPGGEISQ